jgi:hypothetical protein
MKTLFDPQVRAGIVDRIGRATPEDRPRWGTLTVAGALEHLVQSMKLATGELEVPSRNLPFRFTPLRQLIVYLLPWPKGAPSTQELFRDDPRSVDAAARELSLLVEIFAARERAESWPEHPAFGDLGRRGWGVLVYRHIDHHLRQFGL